MNRRLAIALTVLLGAGWTSPTFAQDKPVHIIVPYTAGGNADSIARLYGEALAKKLGRPIVIDNRPGAGGIIGAQAAARSPNDGSVLFLAPTAVLIVTPHVKQTPYDPNDFVPIARITTWLPLMIVRKDFPGDTFAEVIEQIRKNPGKYSFGSAGPATMSQLMGELMNLKLGIKTLHVPYKGSVDEVPDLMSGRIDMSYDTVMVPQVKAGQLRAIASITESRNPELPNVLTLKELGVDLDVPNWYGLFAPKGTPSAVVNRLGEATKEIVAGFDKTTLSGMSMASACLGPADFKLQLAKDDALMRDVIAKANVKME
jgi:tripartite-type tricarboxylate transporter receptor subunit TctC